jgi:hypothetical protein
MYTLVVFMRLPSMDVEQRKALLDIYETFTAKDSPLLCVPSLLEEAKGILGKDADDADENDASQLGATKSGSGLFARGARGGRARGYPSGRGRKAKIEAMSLSPPAKKQKRD